MKLQKGINNFTLRNLDKSDAAAYLKFFSGLDSPSIRCRFGHMMAAPSLDKAHEIVSLDPVWDPALAVFDKEEATIVAVGRFHSDLQRQTAEMAVVVAPGMRRLGLARTIVNSLIEIAVARGLKRLRAYVVTRNAPIIKLLRSFGFVIESAAANACLADGEIAFTLTLEPNKRLQLAGVSPVPDA